MTTRRECRGIFISFPEVVASEGRINIFVCIYRLSVISVILRPCAEESPGLHRLIFVCYYGKQKVCLPPSDEGGAECSEAVGETVRFCFQNSLIRRSLCSARFNLSRRSVPAVSPFADAQGDTLCHSEALRRRSSRPAPINPRLSRCRFAPCHSRILPCCTHFIMVNKGPPPPRKILQRRGHLHHLIFKFLWNFYRI